MLMMAVLLTSKMIATNRKQGLPRFGYTSQLSLKENGKYFQNKRNSLAANVSAMSSAQKKNENEASRKPCGNKTGEIFSNKTTPHILSKRWDKIVSNYVKFMINASEMVGTCKSQLRDNMLCAIPQNIQEYRPIKFIRDMKSPCVFIETYGQNTSNDYHKVSHSSFLLSSVSHLRFCPGGTNCFMSRVCLYVF